MTAYTAVLGTPPARPAVAASHAHSITSRLLRSLSPNSCVQYQVLTGLAMDGVPIDCPAVRLPYNGFTYSGALLIARPVFVGIATMPARCSAASPPSTHGVRSEQESVPPIPPPACSHCGHARRQHHGGQW